MGESTLPDSIMNGNPTLDELITHAETRQWKTLGAKLGLEGAKLGDYRSCVEMYDIWINKKMENETTRKDLIVALRAILDHKVADEYVKHLKTLVSLYK